MRKRARGFGGQLRPTPLKQILKMKEKKSGLASSIVAVRATDRSIAESTFAKCSAILKDSISHIVPGLQMSYPTARVARRL